jgi:hypothetical protein
MQLHHHTLMLLHACAPLLLPLQLPDSLLLRQQHEQQQTPLWFLPHLQTPNLPAAGTTV